MPERPDVIYGAAIGGAIALLTAFLTNRNARKRQAQDLNHSSTEKDKERHYTLKRETYLPLLEASSGAIAFVMQIPTVPVEQLRAQEPMLQLARLIARLGVIAPAAVQEPVQKAQKLNTRLAKLGEPIADWIDESERPDFCLRYRDKEIGLEVTRSIFQEEARGRKLHTSKMPQQCAVTTHLIDGPRRRSDDEIVADMSNLNGGWTDFAERMQLWKEKVARSLRSKRAKLNQAGFRYLTENWLLVVDDPGLGNDVITRDLAFGHLTELFVEKPECDREFHVIFILSRGYLFRRKGNTLSVSYCARGYQPDSDQFTDEHHCKGGA